MSPFMKSVYFIIFLLIYALWAAGHYKLNKRLQEDMLRGKSFFAREMILLLSLSGFFIFIFMMSGFLSIALIGLFLAATHLGFLIEGFLRVLSGPTDPNWQPRTIWIGGAIGIKYGWLMMATMLISFLAVIIYPVSVGTVYFKHQIPSEYATLLVFRYTLTFLFGFGLIILIPMQVIVLSSENLDDSTRTVFLTRNVAGLVTTALYMGLIFWAFNIINNGYELSVGDFSFAVSPILILVILAFLLFTGLLPYIMGIQRAKKWRIILLQKQQRWIRELLDVLLLPTPTVYIQGLQQVQQHLEAEYKKFIEEDEIIGICQEIDQKTSSDLPQDLQKFAAFYRISRDLDPRFNYLDFLNDLDQEVHRIANAFENMSSEDERTRNAGSYALAYISRRDELSESVERVRESQSFIQVGLSAIASPIVSIIVGIFVKWAWGIFIHSSAP
jgi:hypothetical protein